MRDSKLQFSFFSQVSWCAALALLSLGLTVAPQRLAAQAEAAKSEATSQTAATPESAKPAANEEEQQANAFRLEGPVVKWTAKTLNLSVETTANIFEVINFLIIALAIAVPLGRWLPKYLRQRKEKLQSDIASARKVTEDANARLSAVEAKLATLGDEIQKFRDEVEIESKQDEARIKASLAEESTRIVESAEQEIGVAAAQARRGLRNFATGLAIDRAAQQLVLTPEADRALIAEFVSGVARNGSAGGGNN